MSVVPLRARRITTLGGVAVDQVDLAGHADEAGELPAHLGDEGDVAGERQPLHLSDRAGVPRLAKGMSVVPLRARRITTLVNVGVDQ